MMWSQEDGAPNDPNVMFHQENAAETADPPPLPGSEAEIGAGNGPTAEEFPAVSTFLSFFLFFLSFTCVNTLSPIVRLASLASLAFCLFFFSHL